VKFHSKCVNTSSQTLVSKELTVVMQQSFWYQKNWLLHHDSAPSHSLFHL
jgi:hypothetical protein